jgi:hypothetical protein
MRKKSELENNHLSFIDHRKMLFLSFVFNTKERNKEKVKHGGGYDTAVHAP